VNHSYIIRTQESDVFDTVGPARITFKHSRDAAEAQSIFSTPIDPFYVETRANHRRSLPFYVSYCSFVVSNNSFPNSENGPFLGR
jgi:hypothetical protein